MSIADAVRVIAIRESLVDLDFALSLLGYQLGSPLEHGDEGLDEDHDLADTEDEEEGDAEETAETYEGFGRVVVSPPDGDPTGQGDRGPGFRGLRWYWGLGDHHDDAPARRLIPHVLENDEILTPALTRQEGLPLVDRPRTRGENAELTAERVAGYARRWDRERMHRLLLRRVPGRRIDVDRIVRRLAQGEAVTRLPVLPRSKVALPIQVVHDIGLYAGPFGLDLRALLDVVRFSSVPGVELLAFRHSLAGGCGTGPVWRWRAYRVPSRASCVLLISGGCGPDPVGRAREFHHLMASLNRRGHHARAVWFGKLPAQAGPLRPEHWVVRNR
ncbi:hypothetical protein [Streptomyces collinus]|uniref:hypothetical protein n=1 Tax=Streptomyces collinus TaxID=42684 RepID=UPI0037B54DD4